MGLFEQESQRMKKLSKADLVAGRKASLAHELCGNTRAAIDPFSTSQTTSSWQPSLKRKKTEAAVPHDEPVVNRLVEYDSDTPYHSFPHDFVQGRVFWWPSMFW